ncbi:hypothetical protein [Maribacter sp. R77961]
MIVLFTKKSNRLGYHVSQNLIWELGNDTKEKSSLLDAIYKATNE